MIRKEESIELFHKVYLDVTRGSDKNESISRSEVLKIHLMTEVILDNIISVSFNKNSDAISVLELTYCQKLQLCSNLKLSENNLKLSPDVVNSLKELNKLRNRIVLELNTKISRDDVEGLFIGMLKSKRNEHYLNGTSRLILSLYKSMIYINMLNPANNN